ncbi:MAG: purine-binding chemotaxis protein CheW [Butyrivibrio sp.]|uniref:chemotaxis protein CheW n=1 Tax=Butyrivibrio sp. TaxID=28121 RepID=UPI001B4AAF85|nr:chemotaxis protein CheW [Butyrivibrio sp.]MBP3816748.1 purine-binding chemotaxis protein CheW [Butyrivibrio sp.]MBQ8031967.1 purine-binding chemotaxis protein CheW [Butyrivibrio sp.]MBQ9301907.1 purine-binding chemotaxis protein CheW [Butyrivibrio sp.]
MNELRDNSDVGELIQYIVIKIDDEQYGINIKFIDNIVRMQQITRVPQVDEYLKGVINIRGEIVPVMSVRMKMGLAEDVITNKSRIIILKTDSGDLVGIIVDQVNQVLTIDSNNVEKVRYDDKKAKSNATFVSGVGHYDGGLVSILDLEAVVSDKEAKEKASNAS